MKIAYFIGTLRKEDGVTTVLLTLVREAQKKGIQSIIVTGWAEDTSISFVPVIQIPSFVFPLYRDYRIPWPGGMHRFEKQLDEFGPDIIHIHSPDTIASAALKYAKKKHIPILATNHTNFAKYLSYYHISFLQSFVWFLLRRLYKHMFVVTTPSPVTTKELTGHGITNVKTVPWGVDFTRFDPGFRSDEWRKKILKESEKSILLCVCRLTWEKDLKTLADTYNLLREKRKDFAMVIAGDGPARKELESLMPGVVFLGHIEGRDLSEAYASSDILLFPSSTETFGNVTIEAMASGIVPVVADAGGPKSLVEDGKTGFLAKPKDAEDFSRQVARLLDDSELQKRISAADLEFVKNFSWENVFDKLLVIYTSLLQRAKF